MMQGLRGGRGVLYRSFLVAAVIAIFGLSTSVARADAGWFESGDTVLRNDLQLLNDAGVIRLPLAQWPLPRAAVKYALENAKEHFAVNKAVMTALNRVKGRVAAQSAGRDVLFGASLTAGDAGLLRDFDTLGRDSGELSAFANLGNDRAEVTLRITGVADADDGHNLRADGSHATVQLGNWLLSAHTLDRWWGPAHESSLILSNNARPMPTLMVERAEARAFESKWLSWIGPWRMSFGVSQMEKHRQDIESPLFMAWRVTIMPLKDLEIGFSRTAQFCGKQLECNLNVFGNLLAGNDNVGIDATAANEPGNQMAGFDLRWNSPIGDWPYAIYSQMIGEDESSYMPAKFLSTFGAEVWKPLGDGGLLQAYLEYSDTSCSGTTSRPRYRCAYNQGRFDVEGYRYEGRVIGHTTDRDSRSYALGATYTALDGSIWSATARSAELNRKATDDPLDTVAQIQSDYTALELGWRGELFGQKISIDAGVERIQPLGSDRQVNGFGFVGWRYEFR